MYEATVTFQSVRAGQLDRCAVASPSQLRNGTVPMSTNVHAIRLGTGVLLVSEVTPTTAIVEGSARWRLWAAGSTQERLNA
jgi:hypothetical protein